MGFILGAQTSGAEFHLLEFSVNQNSGWMDIRVESPISMLLRMADIFTE